MSTSTVFALFVTRTLFTASSKPLMTYVPVAVSLSSTRVNVPFHTLGRAAGVVQGGVLNITRRTLPLRTTPANIPVSIDADITHLQLKDTISVGDLKFPEGVECALRPNLTLAIILEPRKATAAEEEEDAAAAAAAAPAAEGEASADADKASS